MKLILIHGRSQGFSQTGLKEAEIRLKWINALYEGLKKNNLDLPISENDIIFPYYGDVLDNLVKEYEKPVIGITARGTSTNTEEIKFFREFLEEVAVNAEISKDTISSKLDSQYRERGFLNWEWIQAILRAIDNKTPWGEASIKKFTYDVFLYLTVDPIREAIDNEIIKHFTSEPCVVVGHSLGSIVSYNTLSSKRSGQMDVKKLITVGSPLGIQAIKNRLAKPLKIPKSVKNGWFNGYDDSDYVALNPLTKAFFNVEPDEIENKKDVKNQTDNHHGIEGYLNDKDIAEQIYSALVDLK
ncbi:hypothetical protein [Chryseobacterium sp.]|uniref:PGAP1-like alpha/beta domain-containing protein n=1 Tax=Chryseobacterium sp. TaxID=1871047 RepID=UPI0031CF3240